MKILLVDDDAELRESLAENLRRESWEILEASDANSASERLAEADLVVSDIKMPGKDGLVFLREARARRPALEVIMMTGYGSIPSAIEAMRNGARAYLTKPFDPEELILHAREVEEKLRLRDAALSAGRGDLVGVSDAMKRVYADVDAANASNAPVLILGETGTGKEATARAVHDGSPRRRGPFIAVNLGALPRELVESELFGHERGAFTGALSKKRGRFSIASGGTLFLDEIDSAPLEIQPKLLRALENREVWPLGSEKGEIADVRLIAATNADLEELIAAGRMREDLYYRLNVLRIELPPLRRRPEDIPVIARAVLNRMRKRAELEQLEVSADALADLMKRRWPGNVRELGNALERALAVASAKRPGKKVRLEREDFGGLRIEQDLPFKEAREKMIEEWTKLVVLSALERSGGGSTAAARLLRMNRTAFLRLVKKYGLRED